MEFVNLTQKLELENAQLKQHIEEHVTDANKQTKEIVRMRLIVERTKARVTRVCNAEAARFLLEILNEAGKGGGKRYER
jgi:ferritin-like metal-binding protein YciE